MACALCSATSAQAVYLNPHGLGQVLVFPYYTANSGNGTLIAIANTTAAGKAVKLRFHEGYDGRGVLDFNVYLAPHARWSGEVVNRDGNADSQASIITYDTNCTVPAFQAGANGQRYLDFSDASYAGENTAQGPTGNSDGGPTTPDRTREGHFDVIEMGEVTNASHGTLTAILPNGDAPANCAQLVGAWADGGYWTQNPGTDLSPPTGGLDGAESIIDVAQGLMYSAIPAAIDDFSSAAQHSAPGDAAPDLNTASASAGGVVGALVPIGGRLIELDYANPVDAISALFMTDTLYNEFDIDSALAARTDWVVTAPTKRFYVDPNYVGDTGAPPFDHAFASGYTVGTVTTTDGTIIRQFASAFPYACVKFDARMHARDGTEYQMVRNGPDGLVASAAMQPCLETSVLPFELQSSSASPFPVPLSALGSALTNASDPTGDTGRVLDDLADIPFTSGTLSLDLAHDGSTYVIGTPNQIQQRLTPATNGDVLVGLPVIGFVAFDYVNGAIEQGVLANYSGQYPHRASVTCQHGASGC